VHARRCQPAHSEFRLTGPCKSDLPPLFITQNARIAWTSSSGGYAMQALTLMIVYVLTLLTTQFVGFLISRLVDYQFPTLGLMTFLILFLAAFGLAWLPALRITEFLIRSRGYVVETQQSGRIAS
jgi:hypothetical protein